MFFVRLRPVHLFQDGIGERKGEDGAHDHGVDHAGPREIAGDDDSHDERAREGGKGDGVNGEGEVVHGAGSSGVDGQEDRSWGATHAPHDMPIRFGLLDAISSHIGSQQAKPSLKHRVRVVSFPWSFPSFQFKQA